MNDIQKYSNTERLYVKQFGGTMIDDARQWLIDADIETDDGKTVSIKDQLRSSAKSGNIAVEMETINPKTGQRKEGWLKYINTVGFAVLCNHPVSKVAIWIRIPTSELKEWVEKNKDKLRKFTLSDSSIKNNIQQGRTYTHAWGYLISIQSLLDSGFSFSPLNQEYTT